MEKVNEREGKKGKKRKKKEKIQSSNTPDNNRCGKGKRNPSGPWEGIKP